jgi:flagellar basal body-associated protein FliL
MRRQAQRKSVKDKRGITIALIWVLIVAITVTLISSGWAMKLV